MLKGMLYCDVKPLCYCIFSLVFLSRVDLLCLYQLYISADSLGIRLDEPQPSIPPPKANIDYSHEASEYEQKLIQVRIKLKPLSIQKQHTSVFVYT